MSTPTYTNLVFEGGGVKGIAYAGALKVLEDQKILDKIEKVAGTSAGSIVATLVSLRYSAAEIKTIINHTDFASFEDHKNLFGVVEHYGIYRGQTFLKWLKLLIRNKDFNENITFAELKAKGCRALHVFATDLNMKQVKEFSAETTPNTVVAEAVRASMSIPLFFQAWQFPNSVPDDHLYVDGGTVYNYPITCFDENNEPNMATLGLHLDNIRGVRKDDNLEKGHIFKYIKYLFETLLDAQVIDFERNPSAMKRTVRIDDHGISATDFKITKAEKEELYNSGINDTKAFLAKVALPDA